jgi:hypothetical protein
VIFFSGGGAFVKIVVTIVNLFYEKLYDFYSVFPNLILTGRCMWCCIILFISSHLQRSKSRKQALCKVGKEW